MIEAIDIIKDDGIIFLLYYIYSIHTHTLFLYNNANNIIQP